MAIRIWCEGMERAISDDLSLMSNEFWFVHYEQTDGAGPRSRVVRRFRSLAAAQDVALVVAGPEGGGAVGDIWVVDVPVPPSDGWPN